MMNSKQSTTVMAPSAVGDPSYKKTPSIGYYMMRFVSARSGTDDFNAILIKYGTFPSTPGSVMASVIARFKRGWNPHAN